MGRIRANRPGEASGATFRSSEGFKSSWGAYAELWAIGSIVVLRRDEGVKMSLKPSQAPGSFGHLPWTLRHGIERSLQVEDLAQMTSLVPFWFHRPAAYSTSQAVPLPHNLT